jgi:hypothetical protein
MDEPVTDRPDRPPRAVAIKVLREELVDERRLAWFANEIQLSGAPEHPHIAPIYDGRGLNENPPFYIMRWIDGATLDDSGNRARFSAPLQAAALLVKLAGAVHLRTLKF